MNLETYRDRNIVKKTCLEKNIEKSNRKNLKVNLKINVYSFKRKLQKSTRENIRSFNFFDYFFRSDERLKTVK